MMIMTTITVVMTTAVSDVVDLDKAATLWLVQTIESVGAFKRCPL
jgi:hypothetical protein